MPGIANLLVIYTIMLIKIICRKDSEGDLTFFI